MEAQDIISSLSQELLPGIPNDVALDEIATKLLRRDAALLSSLNQSSRQVIESQLVYNARVRRHSLETCVVVQMRVRTAFSQRHYRIYLYSPKGRTLHQLPQVPHAVYRNSNFIALNGKLYSLGGISLNKRSHSMNKRSHQTMHVLDLAAGDTQWKQCTAMLEPRISFQCGIMDGKLYVFGGTSPDGTSCTCASELYDPKLDAWSPIMPMVQKQFPLRVTCMGEELIVACQNGHASSWQVYHPLKDEWRVVESRMGPVDRFSDIRSVFIMQEKFYSANSDGFHVYNSDSNSWAHWCSIAWDGLGPSDSVILEPRSILPVNNELLAMVRWKRRDNGTNGWYILQSSGFSSNDQQVVWSIGECPTIFESLFAGYFNPLNFLCTIEL